MILILCHLGLVEDLCRTNRITNCLLGNGGQVPRLCTYCCLVELVNVVVELVSDVVELMLLSLNLWLCNNYGLFVIFLE